MRQQFEPGSDPGTVLGSIIPVVKEYIYGQIAASTGSVDTGLDPYLGKGFYVDIAAAGKLDQIVDAVHPRYAAGDQAGKSGQVKLKGKILVEIFIQLKGHH